MIKKQLILSVFVLIFLLGMNCKKENNNINLETKVPEQNKSENTVNNDKEVAVIETKHGKIVIRFFTELAPKHVESFKSLAKKGFYDGTTFHRVIPGFMIQGGDPVTKEQPDNRAMHGTGGPGYQVPAEFSKTSHKRGILSAARAADPNSAGSQFFICVKDSPFLDGQYTVYGEVIEGMDVADKIVNEKRDGRDNPMDRVEMKVKIEER